MTLVGRTQGCVAILGERSRNASAAADARCWRRLRASPHAAHQELARLHTTGAHPMRVSFVVAMAPAYVALLLGCNNGQGSPSPPASGTSTPATPAAGSTANGDPDQAVNGAGV